MSECQFVSARIRTASTSIKRSPGRNSRDSQYQVIIASNKKELGSAALAVAVLIFLIALILTTLFLGLARLTTLLALSLLTAMLPGLTTLLSLAALTALLAFLLHIIRHEVFLL